MNMFNQEVKEQLGFLPVAFVGGVRSGKSTASQVLVEEFGYAPTLSFGSKLKEVALEAFKHLPISQGAKPVTLYQKVGQSLRAIDEDVWVSHVADKFNQIKEYTDVTGVVIDDLRQPNEYQWARDNGFIIIRIVVPEEVRVKRAEELGEVLTEDNLNYETESYYSNFKVDAEIINEGSEAEFRQAVVSTYTKLIVQLVERKKQVERDSIVPLIKSLPYAHATALSGSEVAYEIYTSVSQVLERHLGEGSIEYKVIEALYIDDKPRKEVAERLGISEWKVRVVRNYALDTVYPYLKGMLNRNEY